MAEDIQLLRQHAENRAEGAFAALVERHISFVYAAAMRQLGGAAHRAEDVTQTVFIHLARQATSLTRRDDIVGWLYTTTHHVASALKRSEARRQRREQEAQTMHELLAESVAQADWERLRPVLDEALLELSERDRQAVLLRFFKNEGFSEVGRKLGLSEDAARMRVERALNKLHALLAKRGITSTTAALSVAFANEALVAAPAGLAASVTSTVMSGGAAVVAGAGSLAAIFGFMSASKITVSVAVAGVLAAGFTIYQTTETGAIARDVEQTRSEATMFNARLATLASAVQTAEQEKAKADLDLERTRAEKARAASTGKARQTAVELERKQKAKALQEFLDRDSELLKLRYDATVARHKAAIGWRPNLSAEKIAERAEKSADRDEANDVKKASGLEPAKPSPGADAKWIAQEVVPRNFYHLDEPYTKDHAARLETILANAQTSGDRNVQPFLRFDWDRVLAEAASFLSPRQLEGLRGIEAWGRTDSLLELWTP